MERAGVGNQCHIKTFGDLAGHAAANGFAKVIDHLADSRGGRVDPVNSCKLRARRVMIDVYGKLAGETVDTGTFDVGTFDDEHGIVLIVDRGYLSDLVCSGQRAVGDGNGVS